LCIGLGIALFGVATLVYFNGSTNNEIELRSVGEKEAVTVCGGGELGTTCRFVIPLCGGPDTQSPCSATSGYTTSDNVGDKKPTAPYNCGAASCGEYSPSMITVAE
jgi:hypothetical protein